MQMYAYNTDNSAWAKYGMLTFMQMPSSNLETFLFSSQDNDPKGMW